MGRWGRWSDLPIRLALVALPCVRSQQFPVASHQPASCFPLPCPRRGKPYPLSYRQ